MAVEVFFDYTCGFSNRARHWLDGLEDVEFVWRPFSLLEQNRGDASSVFDRADNVSLIALAVHEAVRAAGADVDAYRRRMFSAWHEGSGRLSTEDIVGFGSAAGLSGFDHREAFALLAGEHAEAKRLGVFGTPTIVFGLTDLAYVKLDAAPQPGRERLVWEQLQGLGHRTPELREWQRVTAPEGAGG